jgi:TPP-dependent pyruvate/acetoin dehydrogenase alpha subunit
MFFDSTPSGLYHQMLRIRRFEETVLNRFPLGQFYGTTHTYVGQEANAVGVLSWLEDGDIVVSNHRCHGHYLAYGGPMHALAAELMGRATGVCGGRGGSQHLKWKDFYANGILGGTVPLAVGMAFAEVARHSSQLVFLFIGDGTLGQGVVYESLNMAALWHLPLVIILENNRYAQSTPIHLNLAGDIPARFEAFDIPAVALEADDVNVIREAAGEIIGNVRKVEEPRAMVLHTYRFAPHSKGDDTRDLQEIERYRANDPLQKQAKILKAVDRERIECETEAEVSEAFRLAEDAPMADPSDLTPVLGFSL